MVSKSQVKVIKYVEVMFVEYGMLVTIQKYVVGRYGHE